MQWGQLEPNSPQFELPVSQIAAQRSLSTRIRSRSGSDGLLHKQKNALIVQKIKTWNNIFKQKLIH